MSEWVAIPCLKALQGEFDQEAPGRDKGAEGFVGDTSHTSSSDHTPDEDSDALRGQDSDSKNEVHAYDCDSSGPWPDGKRGDIKGSWFDKKIHALVDQERARWRDPNDKCRLNYVIWFDQIADKDNDFQWVEYTGTSDPHTNHAHFSARYETECENDTSPWGVADMSLSSEDKTWITNEVKRLLEKDGAVARGLRQQPQNLSDTERNYQVNTFLDRQTGYEANPTQTYKDLLEEVGRAAQLVLDTGGATVNLATDAVVDEMGRRLANDAG